ncbi:hypothetical protein PSE_2658 [Pseudovibrio sp. FO-BEG1]|nr:hypothetical protein PSE_2658 [Pseudovibrio sp. FO-BEG1]
MALLGQNQRIPDGFAKISSSLAGSCRKTSYIESDLI